jgi:hypothetical protein
MSKSHHMGKVEPDGTITIDGFTADELVTAHSIIDGARTAVRELEKLPPHVQQLEPIAKLLEASRKLVELQEGDLPSLAALESAQSLLAGRSAPCIGGVAVARQP